MEPKYFPLDSATLNKPMRIMHMALGILSVAIAIAWAVIYSKSVEGNYSSWITLAFLVLFGIFQILTGLGKTVKFMIVKNDSLYLKTNSVLPGITITANSIDKIEIYSLNINFTIKNQGKKVIRFGTTAGSSIGPVHEELILFAQRNGVTFSDNS